MIRVFNLLTMIGFAWVLLLVEEPTFFSFQIILPILVLTVSIFWFIGDVMNEQRRKKNDRY